MKTASHPVLFLLALTVSCGIAVQPSNAQISLAAESRGLGGGTAYLTGYEALFVNPANIYLQEQNYSWQVSVFQPGYYYDSLLPIHGNLSRTRTWRQANTLYRRPPEPLDHHLREEIMNRHFGIHRRMAELSNNSEMYWIGIKWVRPDRSYALSARTRISSRYHVGRHLFSNEPIEQNGTLIFDRSFLQRYQVLHEFSFGIAEPFTLLNGLLPQLSEFVVGIAPKVVIPGSFLEANYEDVRRRDAENGHQNHATGYSLHTAGVLTDQAQHLLLSEFGGSTPGHYVFRDLMKPAGVGFGIDIGLSYLITFDDDFLSLRHPDGQVHKMLRLSFAITDVGFVYYTKEPFYFHSAGALAGGSDSAGPVQTTFTGAPNEHYSFLSQLENFTNLQEQATNTEPFETVLPLAIRTGAVLRYNRIKLAGDVSYSVVKSAFNPSGFTSYFGLEMRPFPFLPLQAGTRLAPHLPGYYSFGSGIETRYFEVNGSIQLKSNAGRPTSELIGASAGLRLYLE